MVPQEAKKILIVEDDPLMLKVLSDMFAREGFEILSASDGEAGLSIALNGKPDLILLDIIMPKMDGFMVLEKLRKDEWGKQVPVIILTNLGDAPEDVAHALEQGAHDFLVKGSWALPDVVERVKQRLNI